MLVLFITNTVHASIVERQKFVAMPKVHVKACYLTNSCRSYTCAGRPSQSCYIPSWFCVCLLPPHWNLRRSFRRSLDRNSGGLRSSQRSRSIELCHHCYWFKAKLDDKHLQLLLWVCKRSFSRIVSSEK